MKNNLKIGGVEIKKFKFDFDKLWKDTITITHEISLTAADRLDIYIILKSYIDNEAALVFNAFFILESSVDKARSVLQKIPLYKLKKMNDFYEFLDWWDLVGKKIWQYEGASQKINIVLVLNIKNLREKFPNCIDTKTPPIPRHPWEKKILNNMSKKNKTISNLKRLLKKSHNIRDESD